MILISILAHERLDVLLDQIANFKKFAPRAIVVIHLARQMVEAAPKAPEILRKQEDVWVNDAPLYTGFGLVLKCHVSNYLYAEKAGLEFTHFCLHSSNDLFVRQGVENYVVEHGFGFFKFDLLTEPYGFSNWRPDLLRDRTFHKIMRAAGAVSTTLYASQVEGTFFPKEAFGDFVQLFVRHAWKDLPWPISYVHGSNLKWVLLADKYLRRPRIRKYLGQYAYPKEELYLANFFANKSAAPATPYCYMNWAECLLITESDIEIIRQGGIPGGEYEELFSVKRIDRDINNPLRKMISALP